MSDSNLITPYIDCNPKSVDVWFLDDFDPRDPKQRGGSWPVWMWKYHASIRYIVGLIASKQAIEARRRRNVKGWVALRWEDAWPLFPSSGVWGDVRQELLDRKILECDDKFTRGEKSKWYKLAWDWRYHAISPATVTDRRLIRKIAAIETNRGARNSWEPVHYHLDWNLKHVRVDESLIQPWIRQRFRSRRQYLTWLKIIMLQSGLAELTVDGYWRVHSAVTSMRRPVRSAFRINGEPLAEVDISNSQPLLIGYIVAKIVTGEWSIDQVLGLGQKADKYIMFQTSIRSAKGSEKNNNEGEERKNPNCRENLHLTPIMDGLPKDLIDYLRMCEAGIFNRTMGETWGVNYDDDPAKVKRMAFKYILFDRVHPFCSQWKAFKARFPTVAIILKLIKADDYGVSSRACQRLESAIMVGTVADRFRLVYPSTPIQTIHDSLLVPQDALGDAREAIREAFAMLGLEVALKVKGAA